MSEGLKETLVYGTLASIFVLFTLVMPITIAQNHKHECISLGMQKSYTASDIVSICGRH